MLKSKEIVCAAKELDGEAFVHSSSHLDIAPTSSASRTTVPAAPLTDETADIPAIAAMRPTDAEFEVALRNPIRIPETDFTEAVDLKRIVAKMKSDLRRYLADGGTIDGYIEEVVKRQKLEVSYREKAEKHAEALRSSMTVSPI